MNRSALKSRTEAQTRMSHQIVFYTLIVVAFGVGFTLWARHLGLPWRVVIGVLFIMEALPSAIASLTEWWRLSTVGFSTALTICGFCFPLVNENRMFVLVGGSVFFGSLLSAGILYWQVRNKEASSGLSCSSKEAN